VAQVPPPSCCDEMGKNAGGGGAGRGGYDCSKMELPSIYFDDDKYYLDPNNEGTLHTIAERLQMCPDIRLVITGKDESKNDRKYNEQLAYNRSYSVVDYLADKYGVSRDRFIVKYEGGAKANNASPLEKKRSRKVEMRYATDGETGDSNPPAPHPGLKAGSNK
jgi:outer membrane protein OmpA-like peptidoglycan-associated protein